MAVIFVGDQIGFHHDGDIGGVELRIDHRAVTDEAAEAQIPLDQRRQAPECPTVVHIVEIHPPHLDIAVGQGARAQRWRREMIIVEIGQLIGPLVRVGARQARAAEHQIYPVAIDIGGDAAPQQLHHRAVAIIHVHARTAQLQQLALKTDQRRNVILVVRVETPHLLRRRLLDQPIGAHNAFRPRPDRVIHHQKMIGHRIERIDVARLIPRHCRRLGAHFLIEHAPPQRLHGVDLGFGFGNAHAQMAGPQLAKTRPLIRAEHRPVADQAAEMAAGHSWFGRHPETPLAPCSATILSVGSAGLALPLAAGCTRRPYISRRVDTSSKPSRAAIALISVSCSAPSNSITRPVSISIR
jgi:hypothetical protein